MYSSFLYLEEYLMTNLERLLRCQPYISRDVAGKVVMSDNVAVIVSSTNRTFAKTATPLHHPFHPHTNSTLPLYITFATPDRSDSLFTLHKAVNTSRWLQYTVSHCSQPPIKMAHIPRHYKALCYIWCDLLAIIARDGRV